MATTKRTKAGGARGAKKTSAKKTPAKKTPAKKTPANKAPAKKVPAKKTPANKAPAKKVPAKKTPAKKTPAKKAPAKKTPRGVNAIRQEVRFAGSSPARVFAALVDPVQHAQAISADYSGAAEVGAEFTAWDGYIQGRHLELVPGRRIVQAWRTTEFPDDAPDSRLELDLTPEAGGSLLVLVHSDLPPDQIEAYAQGWIDFYWDPLKAYLADAETGADTGLADDEEE